MQLKGIKKIKNKKKEQENSFNIQSLIALSWLMILENDLVLIIININWYYFQKIYSYQAVQKKCS